MQVREGLEISLKYGQASSVQCVCDAHTTKSSQRLQKTGKTSGIRLVKESKKQKNCHKVWIQLGNTEILYKIVKIEQKYLLVNNATVSSNPTIVH